MKINLYIGKRFLDDTRHFGGETEKLEDEPRFGRSVTLRNEENVSKVRTHPIVSTFKSENDW